MGDGGQLARGWVAQCESFLSGWQLSSAEAETLDASCTPAAALGVCVEGAKALQEPSGAGAWHGAEAEAVRLQPASP